LGIGHIRTKTHDYVRHGTLTLFAALNYLEGKLITRLAARHRHQEWLAFLKLIDQQSSAELDIHIIADNYASHQHPQVKKWLARHSRFHMHYTPTSSSWMNLVERFFGDLTAFISEKSFASTRELADAIITFLAARNDIWKAKGEDILRKIDAARRALAADERNNIGPLVELLDAVLDAVGLEVIFVDDDSPNGSAERIRDQPARPASVMPAADWAAGRTTACIEGARATSAPYIAVMDADIQHDEKLLPQMLAILESEPVILVASSTGRTPELLPRSPAAA
jgi:transposase